MTNTATVPLTIAFGRSKQKPHFAVAWLAGGGAVPCRTVAPGCERSLVFVQLLRAAGPPSLPLPDTPSRGLPRLVPAPSITGWPLSSRHDICDTGRNKQGFSQPSFCQQFPRKSYWSAVPCGHSWLQGYQERKHVALPVSGRDLPREKGSCVL